MAGRRGIRLPILACLVCTVGLCSMALAQAPAARSTPAPAQPGWVVAVAASNNDAASKALIQGLKTHPWVAANADRVRLVELPLDASKPAQVTQTSAVFVYQQGAKGAELLGGRSGFASADDAVKWVRSMISMAVDTPSRDVSVGQAGHWFDRGQPTASAQSEYTQAPAPQAGVAQPQMNPAMYPPAPQTTTTYAVPVASANLIQAPAQNLVIQQPPPQVVFAPQSSPVVYVPQAALPQAASMPNLYLSAGAPAPTAGLAPLPTTQVAGVAAPTMAAMPVASMPMTAMPMVQTPVAAGPNVAGAALTTSSVSVPASHTSSRVRVRGPGPIASALARLGERMTTLGRTRIETIQETRLETQTTQSPPGQYVTLSSTAASPVLAPQAQQASQPVPPAYCPTPAPSPQASPQSGGRR